MTEKNSNARIKPIVDGIKRSKEKIKLRAATPP